MNVLEKMEYLDVDHVDGFIKDRFFPYPGTKPEEERPVEATSLYNPGFPIP